MSVKRVYPQERIKELFVCRVCLAIDVRLYEMEQNRLMDPYCRLLGTARNITDKLPNYLCSYCAILLLKCDVFRTKCVDAQDALRNVETKANFKQVVHPAYLRQCNTQTIDIVNDKENIYSIDNPSETVKEEVESKEDTNKSDHDDEADNALTNPSKNNIEITVLNIPTELGQKDLVTNLEANGVKIEDLCSKDSTTLNAIKNVSKNNHKTSDIEFQNDCETNSDVEDDITIADLKNSYDLSKYNVSTTNIATVRNKFKAMETNVNKKGRTNNVCKLYNMNAIDLSKEEQIKEIEDRKKSDSYLQARYKCTFCYKGFRMNESLNKHMVIHNDKSGKFVCDLCYCRFINSARLKKHRFNHTKRFTCKECPFVTKYVSQAREHYKWHSGIKDKCKYCGKECSGQSSYYLHLKLYHPTSEDLVRCEICGEVCSGKLGFKIHEKRAHKEMHSMECLCSSCGTQFYCSDALKAHRGAGGACSPRAK